MLWYLPLFSPNPKSELNAVILQFKSCLIQAHRFPYRREYSLLIFWWLQDIKENNLLVYLSGSSLIPWQIQAAFSVWLERSGSAPLELRDSHTA